MSPGTYNKSYLMTAGPTPLPPVVSQVMAEPILYHRAPAFIEIYERALEGLKTVFQTENDVLAFSSSGSGALESAVANLTTAGEPAVVASAGKFGERWAELCAAYGADMTHLEFEWGTKIDPEQVDRALASLDRPAKALFVTHSETSTGVVHDVKTLAEIARKHDTIIVVDAVSGMGAVTLPQDEWGVDVVVAGSQKALMCPPGLGFASVNERALEAAAANPTPRYYFDWVKTSTGQRKSPADSPFTPSVTVWRALDVALGMIEEEGLDNVYARHATLARAARAGIAAIGLERFGPDDDDANVVTGAYLPDEIDGGKLPKVMRDDLGITVAGGQGQLKGKIVRIAHCGYYGAFDIIIAMTGLEMALMQLGYDCEPGLAVGAAEKVLHEAGSPEPAGKA
jgi:aspartate aminotransferase-like enzyme